ncbi:MAG: hypothetical protein WHS38_04825 [Thermodesulforhabdaceae bacterium]
MQLRFVALGSLLKGCPYVITLGVRPQFSCYSSEDLFALKITPVVLFPTSKYVTIFQASGKPTFPSPFSYHFRKWRFAQFALASYLNVPMLKTRCYRRNTSADDVLETFSLPLKILDLKNDQSKGKLVTTKEKLDEELKLRQRMTIIQEESKDIIARLVLVFIFYELTGFKTDSSIKTIPSSVIEQSLKIVYEANLDDIAIEWMLTEKGWLFAGLNFPPMVFLSPEGNTVINRRTFLCHKFSLFSDVISGKAPDFNYGYRH